MLIYNKKLSVCPLQLIYLSRMFQIKLQKLIIEKALLINNFSKIILVLSQK